MATTSPPPILTPSSGPQIDTTTVLSLLSTVAILATAYAASVKLLPSNASKKTRAFFVWHAFDSLIHTFLEGTFLLNCFFASIDIPKPIEAVTTSKGFFGFGSKAASTATSIASAVKDAVVTPIPAAWKDPLILTPPGVFFLNDPERVYGSFYGNNPFAKLWQEYAKADRRWGGADLTVISLELLTVFIGAPLAAYICYQLVQSGNGNKKAAKSAWFWMSLLATGELYGGFMTFAPEWLSGNVNLDGGNWMYLWVYLVFFNMLWVFIPFWILYEAYQYFTVNLYSKEEMVELMEFIPKKDN